MADIDMIPRSYRDGVRLRRTLRRTGTALAAIVLVAAGANGALRWHSAAIERKITALQLAASTAQADLARQASEHAERERRLQQQDLLRGLRREGELAAFAAAIDSALPATAWLTAVNLRRDLQLAPAGAALPAPGGPASIIATGAADGGALVMVSSVELAGQALNYDGITGFLSNLGRVPGMQGVQLLSSGTNPQAPAIDFRAVVNLTTTAPGATP